MEGSRQRRKGRSEVGGEGEGGRREGSGKRRREGGRAGTKRITNKKREKYLAAVQTWAINQRDTEPCFSGGGGGRAGLR